MSKHALNKELCLQKFCYYKIYNYTFSKNQVQLDLRAHLTGSSNQILQNNAKTSLNSIGCLNSKNILFVVQLIPH